MTADRRRGRRDNGLDAVDWVAVDDLDPRVAEYLLDVLGSRGIAAYLQPSMDVNPVTRQSTVPDRPTDRLFVDRAQAHTARDWVRRVQAEAEQQTDLDDAFAGIVASFDRPVTPGPAPWPAAEDILASSGDPGGHRPAPADAGTDDSGGPAPADPFRPAGPIDGRHVTEPSLLDGLDTFGTNLPDLPEEAQERFIPPPPPPLPRISRQAVLGGLAIIGGLLLLLGPGLVPFERGTAMLLGFASILGGATALILRLRPGTDPDDHYHPNDGAHV